MSRSADPADVDVVREALKQILGTEHYQLASPAVMTEVESIYESLAMDSHSLSNPGFLMSVYRSLGDLADGVEYGRTDRVHWAARFLAATFLHIGELSLDPHRRGNAERQDHSTGFSDEPPF